MCAVSVSVCSSANLAADHGRVNEVDTGAVPVRSQTSKKTLKKLSKKRKSCDVHFLIPLRLRSRERSLYNQDCGGSAPLRYPRPPDRDGGHRHSAGDHPHVDWGGLVHPRLTWCTQPQNAARSGAILVLSCAGCLAAVRRSRPSSEPCMFLPEPRSPKNNRKNNRSCASDVGTTSSPVRVPGKIISSLTLWLDA